MSVILLSMLTRLIHILYDCVLYSEHVDTYDDHIGDMDDRVGGALVDMDPCGPHVRHLRGLHWHSHCIPSISLLLASGGQSSDAGQLFGSHNATLQKESKHVRCLHSFNQILYTIHHISVIIYIIIFCCCFNFFSSDTIIS